MLFSDAFNVAMAPHCAHRIATIGLRIAEDWKSKAGDKISPANAKELSKITERLEYFVSLAGAERTPFDRNVGTGWIPKNVCQNLDNGDLSGAYDQLASDRESADTPRSEKLHRYVLRSWIGKKLGQPVPEGERNLFMALAAEADAGRIRDDIDIGRLVQLGFVSRELVARGHLDVDNAFEEYNRCVETAVLFANGQMLVDALAVGGHVRFRERLGLAKEVDRLKELQAYFGRILELSPSPIEAGSFASVLAALSGHEQASTVELTSKLNGIRERWKPQATKDLITTYQRKAYKDLFVPGSREETVAQFFRDCAAVERISMDLSAVGIETERLEVLLGLANASRQFARVFNGIGQPKGAGVTWKQRAAEWSDEAITIARDHGYLSFLYGALETRVGTLNPDKDWVERRARRSEQLELDAGRLESITSPWRKDRATMRAEMTLSEVMSRSWCKSVEQLEPLGEHVKEFILLQKLKSFRSASAGRTGVPAKSDDDNSLNEDVITGDEGSLDIEEGPEATRLDSTWREPDETELAGHLERCNGAILEYLVDPKASEGEAWKNDLRLGRGTVCLVIKAREGRLWVRPFFLSVPDSRLKMVLAPSTDFEGLPSCLPNWALPEQAPERVPDVLAALGSDLFPRHLLKELSDVSRVYLCPHRNLFQIPMHALPTADGGRVFSTWEVSYALKAAHIVSLLKNDRHRRGYRPWSLVDTRDYRELWQFLSSKTKHRQNRWGIPRNSSDEILEEASQASVATMLCHGQIDEARAGRARFRLWSGGRLLAADIQRIDADYSSTDWIVAACDATHARVTTRTDPGLALSLVARGAKSVTSCLFRIYPQTAERFLDRYLSHLGRGSAAAFTRACKKLVNGWDPAQGWSIAASFVSYGLLEEDRVPDEGERG